MKHLLTAEEAATALGVSRATLYAYVSRGLLRALPSGADGRSRRYRADEVAQLQQRREARREPRHAAAQALNWGFPVVDSALTLLSDQGHAYRGVSALDLAAEATIEEVAALLWDDRQSEALPLDRPDDDTLASLVQQTCAVTPEALERMQVVLVLAETQAAWPPTPASAASLHRLLVAASLGQWPSVTHAAIALQQAWSLPDEARPLLDAAMILCADHELNISSFTARCTASAGTSLAGALLAGLTALKGYRHGGATREVARFLDAARAAPALDAFLDERLAAQRWIPGFHHRLYPLGDPRAQWLIARVRAYRSSDASVSELLALIERMERRLDERPTIDTALVLLARALALPADAPLLLFALGRAVGWAAHAIEQADRGLLRPRARYVGPRPKRRQK